MKNESKHNKVIPFSCNEQFSNYLQPKMFNTFNNVICKIERNIKKNYGSHKAFILVLKHST